MKWISLLFIALALAVTGCDSGNPLEDIEQDTTNDTPVPSGPDLASVYFTDVNTGWIVGQKGTILKTVDGGTTWVIKILISRSLSLAPNAWLTFTDIHFWDDLHGCITGDGVLVCTTDGGTTWNAPQIPFPEPDLSLKSVSFADGDTGWIAGFYLIKSRPCTLFGVTMGYDGEAVILKSTDSGLSWVTAFSSRSSCISFYHSASTYFLDSSIGWAELGTVPGILKTNDGGVTWTRTLIPHTWRFDVESIFFANEDVGCLIGEGRSHANFVRTADGGKTWKGHDTGVAVRLNALHLVDEQTGWAVGDEGAIIKTTDGGLTWRVQNSGVGNTLNDVHFVDANTGWAVGAGSIILKTTDGGGTWRVQDSP